MVRRSLLIFAIITYTLSFAFAQEGSAKFTFTSKTLSGTEQYNVEKVGGGFRITATTDISSARGAMKLATSSEFAADWSPTSYKLETVAGGVNQQIEVTRDKNSFQMVGKAGDKSQSNAVEATPNTVLLDNLVVAHYQALVNRMAQLPTPNAGALTMQFLIPQRLTAANGKVVEAGTAQGTLAGAPIQLKKYSLEIASVAIDIWAEAKTNRLMRVVVPLQGVEMTRDGFVAAKSVEAPAAMNCVERDGSFPSDGLVIPGTICLPMSAASDKAAKFPLIVLVHGSGSHDRDETIGPNKPFRDIADSLAGQGIATLRFDKRSFAFPKSFAASFTVEQEVITDAVNAVKFAATQPQIDASQIYVLGHSLGGMLAPTIALHSPNVTGVILLAAVPGDLDQIIARQIGASLQRSGRPQTEIDKQVADLKAQFARVRSGEAKDDERVFMAPAGYWRDLFKRDIPGELRKLGVPVLVLQGGKDIQVLRSDYDTIVKALNERTPEVKKKAPVTERFFPELNHLFMPVQGEATGAEYGRAGHVQKEVTDAIATFVHSHEKAASPKR